MSVVIRGVYCVVDVLRSFPCRVTQHVLDVQEIGGRMKLYIYFLVLTIRKRYIH